MKFNATDSLKTYSLSTINSNPNDYRILRLLLNELSVRSIPFTIEKEKNMCRLILKFNGRDLLGISMTIE